MSSIEWYYAKGNEQLGPVTAAELRLLSTEGKLLPDDLVWREGMEIWVAARSVKGLFDDLPPMLATPPGEAAPAVRKTPSAAESLPSPQPAAPDRSRQAALQQAAPRHPLDLILDVVRRQFTVGFVESTATLFTACGHWGLYGAMFVCLLFAVISSLHGRSFAPMVAGVLSLLILAVMQYVAGRFCASLVRLNRSTRGTISSTTFLDCIAIVAMAAGPTLLLWTVFGAIFTQAYEQILAGLIAFVVCEYSAVIALNPAAVYVSVSGETRAGEEAIGIFSFLLKMILRLVPVAFGAGVVCQTLRLLYACVLVYDAGGALNAVVTAMEATKAIVAYAALPLAVYLLFLLSHLLIDLCRSVLVLPGKLDRLTDKKDG